MQALSGIIGRKASAGGYASLLSKAGAQLRTGRLELPPADALRPIIPNNACILRITAAAGTELADAYSSGTRHFIPP